MSIYNQFKRTWNDGNHGFGRHSYNDAIAAGYTPAQIASAVAGKRVGQRAQDMIAAAQPAYSTGQSAGRSAARDDYQGIIDSLNTQIGGYTNQISGLNNQINEYTTRVNTLTNQYDDALKTIDEVETARDKFESDLEQRTAEYEAARAEADAYREEAVGQQLRAVRSGSTAGGANQSQRMQGSLAGGRTGYSSDSGSDVGKIAELLRAQGGLTDSVLNRKGPVVEQLGGAPQASREANRRSPDAGTGSYYASRF